MNIIAKKGEKKIFYTELSYILGVIAIALGTAMIAVSEIGVAMPVVSAHVIHGLLHDLHWVTLGMVEIACQVVLFVVLAIVCREIKKAFFISMATGVIYSILLDLFIILCELLPHALIVRIALFTVGLVVLALGEILLHHTYIQSEFYEFFIHELTERYKLSFYKVKFIFEATLCLIGVVISFAFHGVGEVHGLGIGTVICALLLVPMSHAIGKLLTKNHTFVDRFKAREFFRD